MLVAALLVCACGEAVDILPPPPSTVVPTTVVVIPPSTSVTSTTLLPTSTTPDVAPATTTTELPPATIGPDAEPLSIPRLASGLPATFLGVTGDHEAVEVDTATGRVIRSIGQLETAADVERDGGPIAAIDGVWRTADHRWFVVSECCEPAAGNMHYLGPDERLRWANHDTTLRSFGWLIVPSPYDDRFIRLGYTLEIARVGGDTIESLFWDGHADGYISGIPSWSRSGTGLHMHVTDGDLEGGQILYLNVPDIDQWPITYASLPWLVEGTWLDGIGTQMSGNLVGFWHTDDAALGRNPVATEGVVFTTGGDLVATFPVETGSTWGGYDPSGRFLIYIDAAGVVRWQGLGQSGTLGEGYLYASW